MKVIKIEPIRVSFDSTGLVDVTYVARCGFLWLRKKTVKRRASSTNGILWGWADNDSSLFDVTTMIEDNLQELCGGKAVKINHGGVIQDA